MRTARLTKQCVRRTPCLFSRLDLSNAQEFTSAMKQWIAIILIFVGSCALAQESRSQFSVRVAAEESVPALQTAKEAKSQSRFRESR
jgi:hypothetical protein